MPFNVATIKDKATSAKNATVTKFQDTRDRHTSTPMSKTKFVNDGYAPDTRKSPPPPPAPSSNRSSYERSRQATSPPPPPPVVRKNTKPAATSGTATGTASAVNKNNHHRRSPSHSPSPSPPAEEERGMSVLERAKAFSSAGVSPAPSALQVKSKPKTWAPSQVPTPPSISTTSSTTSTSPPPPPPARQQQQQKQSSPPQKHQQPSASQTQFRQIQKQIQTQIPPDIITSINWSNLSQDDKQEFFNWLDEFFTGYIDRTAQSKTNARTRTYAKDKTNAKDKDTDKKDRRGPTSTLSSLGLEGTKVLEKVKEKVKEKEVRRSPPPAPARAEVAAAPTPGRGPPPTIKSWSKPTPTPRTSDSDSSTYIPSHPPPTTHGSQGMDLAAYFRPTVHWETAWYADKSNGNMPPPMRENANTNNNMPCYRKGQTMSSSNGITTIQMAAMYSDLTACWFKVTYNASSSSLSNQQVMTKQAWYTLPPSVLPQAKLIEASTTYGETIASFSESFLGGGEFCGRGECWDLANEAIKCFAEYDYVDKPVPSTGRSHGHLIFVGRAGAGAGQGQEGRWRGGDDRIRRGDIVEWKSVKIRLPNGGQAILGDPEHTAIITRDTVPGCSVYDGVEMTPSQLGEIEVVEQSRNFVPTEPKRGVYDMEGFLEGEVWIYRPISMEVYLGYKELECTPPENAIEI